MDDISGEAKQPETEIDEAGAASRPDLARMVDVVRPESFRRRVVLGTALLAVVMAATVLSWMLVREWEDERVRHAVEAMRNSLEQRWSETKLRFLQSPRAICDSIDSRAIRTPEQFLQRAAAIRKASSAYQAFLWIGADGSRVAMSAAEGVQESDVLPYGSESLWQQLRRKAMNGPIVGPSYEGGGFGRSLLLLYYPLGERGDGGGLAVVLRTVPLMESFADDDVRQMLSITVMREGQILYRTGEYVVERDPTLRMSANLPILDQRWVCQIMPTSQFIRQHPSSTSVIVLAVGAAGCLICAGSLLNAMRRRWQNKILERGHIQVVDIISELGHSVSANRGDWRQALLCILETAQPITDSDVIGIYQLSADRRRLELVSTYGVVPLVKSIELGAGAAELLRDVLSGRPLSASRQQRDSLGALRVFEPNVLYSGVIAPLQIDRVIGVMLFGSRSGMQWSDVRCSLVRLWASQTASLVGDEAIHSQMRDALTVQEKLARRREMMLMLLGEIYQAGSTEGTLADIAQHAPPSLGVEACVVALRTKKENELEIVAATGELGVRLFGRKLPLTGEQVVRLSRPESICVLEPHEVEPAGFGKLAEPWLKGLAYVPMNHSDGRTIGCVLLMSAINGAFTNDQLELARVLANQASAAIENAQLNQQIRRDAEMRAMLLRELNHRVKNNLAGIVGLLSMSSNMQMPADVRHWLDRVIERIGNIARAHELFTGGITTVSLSQLVEQVIPSLAVVKPPGVTIAKELGPREIWLKTSQAVSLAMIIHEICYNAIVHGLGARGTLTIRAEQTAAKDLVLQVVDDGTAAQPQTEENGGVATMAPPATSTGLGLRLVKGLVSRELRGRFQMRRRSEGGTIVTVEFPLERERDEGELQR